MGTILLYKLLYMTPCRISGERAGLRPAVRDTVISPVYVYYIGVSDVLAYQVSKQ